MDRRDYENSLVKQSKVCQQTVEAVMNNIDYQALGEVMPIKEIFDAQKIIITGMGDSWLAGVAMKPVFEAVAKVETDAMRAIEFSRHLSSKQLGFSPNTPMVIGISVSGNPARVAECLQRADHYGANTILITDQPNSPSAQVARHVLHVGLPEGTPYGPGANSYIGSLVALTLMALRIGRVKNTISQNQYEDMKKAIMDYTVEVCAKMESFADQAFELAQTWKDLKAYDFIGDYADYATAFFGSAKVLEAFGGYTTYDDSEDWCHINFFLKHPETIGRVVIANSDTPSFNRLKETMAAIEKLESPCMVVTDADKSEFPASFNVFTFPKPRYFWLAPIMQHWAFDLVADYICELNGITQFRRDMPAFDTEIGKKRLRGGTEIVIV